MIVRQPGALLAAWILCGCTGPNPQYVGGSCKAGERQCVQSQARPPYPVVCGQGVDGGLALLDERCPAPAACQEGACVPPPAAAPCTRQQDCGRDQVCVPLDDPHSQVLVKACLPAQAAKAGPGERCEKDADCQSYLCLPFSGGNYCLKACTGDQGCQIPNRCLMLNVTITGISGVVQSCSPG